MLIAHSAHDCEPVMREDIMKENILYLHIEIQIQYVYPHYNVFTHYNYDHHTDNVYTKGIMNLQNRL